MIICPPVISLFSAVLYLRCLSCQSVSKAMGALPMVGISTALLTYTAMGYPLEPDVVAMSVAYFDAWMLVVVVGWLVKLWVVTGFCLLNVHVILTNSNQHDLFSGVRWNIMFHPWLTRIACRFRRHPNLNSTLTFIFHMVQDEDRTKTSTQLNLASLQVTFLEWWSDLQL